MLKLLALIAVLFALCSARQAARPFYSKMDPAGVSRPEPTGPQTEEEAEKERQIDILSKRFFKYAMKVYGDWPKGEECRPYLNEYAQWRCGSTCVNMERLYKLFCVQPETNMDDFVDHCVCAPPQPREYPAAEEFGEV